MRKREVGSFRFIWIFLCLFMFCAAGHPVDAIGMVKNPIVCDTTYSTMDFICNYINENSGELPPQFRPVCTPNPDNGCFKATEDIFTGLWAEWPSLNNIKEWNGFGFGGGIYQAAGLCLLRDLRDTTIINSAPIKVLGINTGTVRQEIGFLKFDKDRQKMEGYHRLSVGVIPLVGYLDLFTQRFKFTAVKEDFTVQGAPVYHVGQYDVYGSMGLELQAEELEQGLTVTIPAIPIHTPVGPIEVAPKFVIGRSVGLIEAPYAGNNMKSLLTNPYPDAWADDLYGLADGLTYTTGANLRQQPMGWVSQVALGGRDPNTTSSVWQPPASLTYPSRPDLPNQFPSGNPAGNPWNGTARSDAEKSPNAYIGADVRIEYNPTHLIPIPDIAKQYIDLNFDVYAIPSINIGISSQLDLWNAEAGEYLGVGDGVLGMGYNNYRGLNIFAGTSSYSRTAIDAGLDLTLLFNFNAGFFHIRKKIIDIHPHTPIASIDAQSSTVDYSASVFTNLLGIVSQPPDSFTFFTDYKTLNGSHPKGENHIEECFASPTPPGPLPPPPQYTGDPNDLLKLLNDVQYPCNVCVGWAPFSYWDHIAQKYVNVPGWLNTLFPSQPAAECNWTCTIGETKGNPSTVGWYDMCSYDPQLNPPLQVTKCATDLQKYGLHILAPNGPRRIPNPDYDPTSDCIYHEPPDCPPPTIPDPNGLVVIPYGSTYSIQWEAGDVTSFDLELSTDGGNIWTPIKKNITGTACGEHGKEEDIYGRLNKKCFDWSVLPDMQDQDRWSDCKIKVIGYNSNGEPVGEDKSDSTFTIFDDTAPVPPGILSGNLRCPGTDPKLCVNYVCDEYHFCLPGFTTVQPAPHTTRTYKDYSFLGNYYEIATMSTDNAGKVCIIYDDREMSFGDQANIRILKSSDSYLGWTDVTCTDYPYPDTDNNIVCGCAEHVAPARFALAYKPDIVVKPSVKPSGPWVIPSGSQYSIEWRKAFANAAKFDLQYSLDNRANWNPIAPQVTGTSFNWTVPTPTANKTRCWVNVIAYDASGDKLGENVSNGPFTIEVVKLTSPNNGEEIWRAGSTHAITWTTNGTKRPVSSVQLFYTTNGGTAWNPIRTAVGTGNPGTYTWKVPAAASARCKVKVVLKDSLGNTLGSDVSDRFFSIAPSFRP